MNDQSALSDAETRREDILRAARVAFAKSGYAATPVTEVARVAGISQAYVFKLFPTKLELFTVVVERCYEQIEKKLNKAADRAGNAKSDKILEAMSAAYVKMMRDPDLLMLQVHAQAATNVPEIREAVRQGTAHIIGTAKARSRAKKSKVQQMIAYGQLAQLITTLDVQGSDETWARILTAGFRPNS